MKIKQDFIPTSNRNRPQTTITPKYITVHETSNESKGADAEAHSNYVKGEDCPTSWHFTVDDKEIIQHLPTNEKGWHAGENGNQNSIGIELCVNSDGDFEKTKKNAQWLIRKLMSELKIPLSSVVTHNYWTGKQCPSTLLSTFESFKKGCVDMSVNRIDANIKFEGKKVEGFIEDGRTYVQVRDLAEMLGLIIEWDQSTKTVTLK